MYNRNVFIIISSGFISRYALVGGLDYASTAPNTGWNPLGIAKASTNPKINVY